MRWSGIRRFNVVKTATVVALMYMVIVAVFAIPFFLLFAIAGVAVNGGPTQAVGNGFGLIVVGIVAALVYGLIGWIATAIVCLLYNFVAGLVGGIEVEVDRPEPPAAASGLDDVDDRTAATDDEPAVHAGPIAGRPRSFDSPRRRADAGRMHFTRRAIAPLMAALLLAACQGTPVKLLSDPERDPRRRRDVDRRGHQRPLDLTAEGKVGSIR